MNDILLIILFVFGTIRQAISILSLHRACKFLNDKQALKIGPFSSFTIAIPVLFEQEILHETVEYYNSTFNNDDTHIVYVTTEREKSLTSAQLTSKEILNKLSNKYVFGHIHYPYSDGTKSDQLNFVVNHVNSAMNKESRMNSNNNLFIVIYDADSRPDLHSLEAFEDSINKFPLMNVFQQVSWFRKPNNTHLSIISNLLLEASALRANRFMLAYELPRLIGRLKYYHGHRDVLSVISNYMFSHVTGHGLCIRQSFLINHPFPEKTILEDMQYSFLLCCMRETVIPINVQDCAEVPPTLHDTFLQSTRWFLGPSRWLHYLITYNREGIAYINLLAFSAFYISIEWLLCAFTPVIFFIPFSDFSFGVKFSTVSFLATYAVTCVYALKISSEHKHKFSVFSLLLYPLHVFIFGLAGFVGLWILLLRKNNLYGQKTRRC